MYAIVTHDEAAAQLRELPAHLVAAYLEVRAGLEVAPWTAGVSTRPSNPAANVYALDFGTGEDATVYYLILEEEHTVHILEVSLDIVHIAVDPLFAEVVGGVHIGAIPSAPPFRVPRKLRHAVRIPLKLSEGRLPSSCPSSAYRMTESA